MTKAIRRGAVHSWNRAWKQLLGNALERICQLRYKHANAKLQNGQINGEIKRFFDDIEHKILLWVEPLINLMHEIRTKDRDDRTEEKGHKYARGNDVLVEDGKEPRQFQIFE